MRYIAIDKSRHGSLAHGSRALACVPTSRGIYFTITLQIIGLILSALVPYVALIIGSFIILIYLGDEVPTKVTRRLRGKKLIPPNEGKKMGDRKRSPRLNSFNTYLRC